MSPVPIRLSRPSGRNRACTPPLHESPSAMVMLCRPAPLRSKQMRQSRIPWRNPLPISCTVWGEIRVQQPSRKPTSRFSQACRGISGCRAGGASGCCSGVGGGSGSGGGVGRSRGIGGWIGGGGGASAIGSGGGGSGGGASATGGGQAGASARARRRRFSLVCRSRSCARASRSAGMRGSGAAGAGQNEIAGRPSPQPMPQASRAFIPSAASSVASASQNTVASPIVDFPARVARGAPEGRMPFCIEGPRMPPELVADQHSRDR